MRARRWWAQNGVIHMSALPAGASLTPPQPIVFLDFDGVLNTPARWGKKPLESAFEPPLVRRVSRFTAADLRQAHAILGIAAAAAGPHSPLKGKTTRRTSVRADPA